MIFGQNVFSSKISTEDFIFCPIFNENKHLLKVMKIDLSRNVRYCIRLDDNNKRLESTYQMYRFKN